MAHALLQISVFPYTIIEGEIYFALFRKYPRIGGAWEGIVGGGKEGETPLETAMHAAFEEAGIMPGARFVPLETFEMIPVTDVDGSGMLPLPQYSFGVEVDQRKVTTKPWLTEVIWLPLESVMKKLLPESSRTALCELYFRVRNRL